MRALLVDVDRWDRADDAAQDAAIAEIRVDGFTFLRMERFTGVQQRVDVDTCNACQGMGGRSHQSGNSDFPDCSVCNNNGTIETPRGTASLSHRVAVFRNASGDEFVLVPGHLDIPAALVARKATWDDAPPGLRRLSDNEVRHAVSRGGSSDPAFGNYSWSESHPFGIQGLGYHHAASIPGAERAQAEAFNELCAETGSRERGDVDKHGFAASGPVGPVDAPALVDKLLLDVDRWDHANDAAQDAAIAKLRIAGFTHARMERFTGIQERVDDSPCPYCDGAYGPEYGRNCSLCHGNAVLNTKLPSVTLSHRVAIFRHTSGYEFVLVPGRLDVAACLVARTPSHGDPPPGLRHLTREELRHAIYRGGGFDQELEQFSDGWTASPFGLERLAESERPGMRWAASIPGAVRAQDDAFVELSSELGAIDRAIVPGALARTGLATSDPLPERTLAVAFSRDGRWLATGHYGQAFVWDASSGHLVSQIRLVSLGAVESIAFSPDHQRFVLATDHEIALCEIATRKLVMIEGSGLPRDHTTKRWVAWQPDGRILIAEIHREEASLSLVDPETMVALAVRRWTGYRYSHAGSFACDDRRAAIGTLHDGALAIWNTDTLEVERHIAVTKLGLIALAGDAVYLIDDGVLATEDRTQISDTPNITFLACSRDGRRVGWSVETLPSSSVRFQDRLTGEHTSIAKTVGPFAFSFDGTRIAVTVERSPRFAAIWAVM